MHRREFIERTATWSCAAGSTLLLPPTAVAQAPPKQLRLWVVCCAHVGTDLKKGRESLADAIRQSEDGGSLVLQR